MQRTVYRSTAAVVAGLAAAAFGGGITSSVVGHADTNIPGINSCPNNHVYVAEYTGGAPEDSGTGTAALTKSVSDADGSSGASSGGSATGSSVGDTVIVCPGTYTGVALTLGGPSNSTGDETGSTKDNVTIRSFSGAGNTIIVGTGAASVFTIEANGVTLGGPGHGFTIETAAASTNPLVEVGTPGAQSTSNEDEACTGSATGQTSGCDAATPAYVATNDQVFDNIFTNLVPAGATGAPSVIGVELDNTINNTVQQNLFTNDVPDNTTITGFQGIVVGTNQAESAQCTNCGTGYSTNINTALFNNAFQNVLQGSHSSCTTATAISLDGWVLDSQVYNNLIQQIVGNNSSCVVTGIESNAFGQLENEQTGTLVPVNGNIDHNTIQQLAPIHASTPGSPTGILLDPQPEPNPGDTALMCENGNLTAAGPCAPSPPSSYTVSDNQFQGLYWGVHDTSLLGQNSYVRDNNFQNVVIGVQKDGLLVTPPPPPDGNALDATNNFWGCDDGPNQPPNNTTTDAGCAKVVGDVAFNPWFVNPVPQAGDDAGDNAGH